MYNSLFSSFSYHISQTIAGNINTYSEVEQILQPIIFASKIRIYPYSEYDRTVCLRAEIIGCVWDGKSLEILFFLIIPHFLYVLIITCLRLSYGEWSDNGSTYDIVISMWRGNVFIFVLWTYICMSMRMYT